MLEFQNTEIGHKREMRRVNMLKIVIGSIEASDTCKFRKSVEGAETDHLEAEVGVDASDKGVLQLQRSKY